MGFAPTLLKKPDNRTLFLSGACCKRGRHLYTTTAPSCCIPAPYCHLSVTLQAISIIVANLQDNGAVFRIFISLLRFSFGTPSFVSFDDPVRDKGCLTGIDVCLTYKCSQVLSHAWPLTVRSYSGHFIFRFYQT